MEKQTWSKYFFFKEHDEDYVKGENNSVSHWTYVVYSMFISLRNFWDTDRRFYKPDMSLYF